MKKLMRQKTPGKKVVMIIAHAIFRDEEYLRPKEALIAAGIKVITASSELSPARGKLGAKVVPDVLVRDVQVADYDAVVFIGGSGAQEYFHDPVCHRLARETIIQGKIVAAICIAPAILANAGVLRGKRATVFPDGVEALERGGAHYTGMPLEIDGNIVTANGPGAAMSFGEVIRDGLLGESR